MNRKIEVIENKEVGRKKMSLSYAERDNRRINAPIRFFQALGNVNRTRHVTLDGSLLFVFFNFDKRFKHSPCLYQQFELLLRPKTDIYPSF